MRQHDIPATSATPVNNGRAMRGGGASVAGAAFQVAVLIDSGAHIRIRYVSH